MSDTTSDIKTIVVDSPSSDLPEEHARVSPANVDEELDRLVSDGLASYVGDFVEGNLLDSFVIQTDWGFVALYEESLNEWSSCYRAVSQSGSAQELWSEWYKFEEEQQDSLLNEVAKQEERRRDERIS